MSDQADTLPAAGVVQTAGQVELFAPGESEGAFFLPASELSKRYTAAQAREIEGKRELIIKCIAAGFPIEDIARDGRVSIRTVTALAALDAEKVAGNLRSHAQAMRLMSARALGIMRAKEGEATYIQAATAASYLAQRANEAEVVAGMGEIGEENKAIASEPGGAGDPCAGLRAVLAAGKPVLAAGNAHLAAGKPVLAVQEPDLAPGDGCADGASAGSGVQGTEAQGSAERAAGDDAGGAAVVQGGPDQAAGAGGGSGGPARPNYTDSSERSGSFGKGDPS